MSIVMLILLCPKSSCTILGCTPFLAYISLVPLPEQIILSILKGERPELSISADEVETYERKGGYTLLAESVVVDPDHPEQLNTVLREVLAFWCKQYPDRYIEKIYADAATEHGDLLARKVHSCHSTTSQTPGMS